MKCDFDEICCPVCGELYVDENNKHLTLWGQWHELECDCGKIFAVLEEVSRTYDTEPCIEAQEGRIAYDAGIPISENPYHADSMIKEKSAWMNGWSNQEMKDIKGMMNK